VVSASLPWRGAHAAVSKAYTAPALSGETVLNVRRCGEVIVSRSAEWRATAGDSARKGVRDGHNG
jgi:hypothetical protein